MIATRATRQPAIRPHRQSGRYAVLYAGLYTLLMLCTSLISAPLHAAPAAGHWRDELPAAIRLGGGELRWFGFRIYHATLWAEQQPFQPQRPFALQLQYHRNISRERLVDTSLDEIRRLSRKLPDSATLNRWRNTLLQAFTDVAPGDELIGVYRPGQGMRLYNQRQLLAEIDDAALAQAFFAIWLDERSHDQGLRQQLLGSAP
ncbi:chalcone isomerase family protein [Pseudoduganella danionis]|uniref:chalcone isomerase family protein n=1 Tax=Pseudoduganella danionis TaxID=1890295 RepID=UPI0035B407AF